MKIRAIYHHPSYHDYTVYFDSIEKTVEGKKFYLCLCMDGHPFHPQGMGQHSSGMLGRHNGHKITFDSLPPDCQRLVKMEME